jgi:hypothetical protein
MSFSYFGYYANGAMWASMLPTLCGRRYQKFSRHTFAPESVAWPLCSIDEKDFTRCC